jgi:hypothetical protein
MVQDTQHVLHKGTVPWLWVRKSQCMGTTSFEGLHVEKVTYMYVTKHRNEENILMWMAVSLVTTELVLNLAMNRSFSKLYM